MRELSTNAITCIVLLGIIAILSLIIYGMFYEPVVTAIITVCAVVILDKIIYYIIEQNRKK